MQKPYLKTLIVAVALVLAALPLVGCSGEVSFTTASLSEETMALGVDSDARPVGPTETFQVDTPEIFCSVKLSHAPSDTEVAAEWIYVEGDLKGYENHTIDTYSLVTDGDRHLYFSMERPDDGWPVGTYKIVFYVDSKEETTAFFSVTDEANPFSASSSTSSSSSPALSEATMALSVDSEARPVNPTSTFAQDTPEIFCSVLVSNVTEPVDLLSEWYYVEGDLEGVADLLIDSVPLTVPVDQYVQFSLTIPDNGWPGGTYKLVIYMDGIEEMSVPFTVESAGNQQSTLLTDVTMALGADDNAEPVNPTSVFPAGTVRVYTTLYVTPDVPNGATLLTEWYSMDGDSPELIDSYEFEVENDFSYYVYYEVDGGWPAGDYAVVLYLDGEQQTVVEYSVS